jgi:hypothetical protein
MARPEVTGKGSKTKAVPVKNRGRDVPAKNRVRERPAVEPAWFSIRTFCAAHHISEAMYYKMKAQGWGPKEALVGNRVLITPESAASWRREREAAAESNPSPKSNSPAPARL